MASPAVETLLLCCWLAGAPGRVLFSQCPVSCVSMKVVRGAGENRLSLARWWWYTPLMNPSTQEFKDSQGYTGKPCLEKQREGFGGCGDRELLPVLPKFVACHPSLLYQIWFWGLEIACLYFNLLHAFYSHTIKSH